MKSRLNASTVTNKSQRAEIWWKAIFLTKGQYINQRGSSASYPDAPWEWDETTLDILHLPLKCRTGCAHSKLPCPKIHLTSVSSLSISNTFDETHYRMPWGSKWGTHEPILQRGRGTIQKRHDLRKDWEHISRSLVSNFRHRCRHWLRP